jgi:CRP-like cAMP-binding protein
MPDVQFQSALARKLSTFVSLSSDELECLADMQANQLKVRRGKQLTQEGQTEHQAFVLQTGWACSYKELSSGGRQIISFPIAGDCVGLRSVLLRTADHSFSALTDAVVSPLEGTHLMKCVTQFPRLGSALLWAASRDEAMVVEHLVSIGRRSAIERTAHFFMELAERLSLVGHAGVPAEPVRHRRCAGSYVHPCQPGSPATPRAKFAHHPKKDRQHSRPGRAQEARGIPGRLFEFAPLAARPSLRSSQGNTDLG